MSKNRHSQLSMTIMQRFNDHLPTPEAKGEGMQPKRSSQLPEDHRFDINRWRNFRYMYLVQYIARNYEPMTPNEGDTYDRPRKFEIATYYVYLTKPLLKTFKVAHPLLRYIDWIILFFANDRSFKKGKKKKETEGPRWVVKQVVICLGIETFLKKIRD
jgi:hypothetical protein